MDCLKHFLLFLLLVVACPIQAQIMGVVTDAETGDGIGFVSVVYEGRKGAAIASAQGAYSIGRHEGYNLTFSAVGYKSRTIRVSGKTRSRVDIS